MGHYEVTDKGHLVMSPEAYHEFKHQKQRSVYIGNWQLAYIPTIDDLIIVDIEQKQWHLYSQFPDAVLKNQLLSALCQHYHSIEIDYCDAPQQQASLLSQ